MILFRDLNVIFSSSFFALPLAPLLLVRISKEQNRRYRFAFDIDEMSSLTVNYRSSLHFPPDSLSEAIRSEKYEKLEERFDAAGSHRGNNNPLWEEENSQRWTAMHFAAIGSTTMPLKWWNWIIIRQQQHSSSLSPSQPSTVGSQLWTRQTEEGQTVVELFFPDVPVSSAVVQGQLD